MIRGDGGIEERSRGRHLLPRPLRNLRGAFVIFLHDVAQTIEVDMTIENIIEDTGEEKPLLEVKIADGHKGSVARGKLVGRRYVGAARGKFASGYQLFLRAPHR